MTQQEALTILKTGANVFLTGEPGAGKSHTINAYVRYLRNRGIEPAITASTGIAATHVGGMTIHSWSGIGIKDHLSAYDLDKIATSEYVVKRVHKTRVLIIDEISMLLPDMLDMVDSVCCAIKQSNEPFGGLQVVFVGDFFQLPPIEKRMSQRHQSKKITIDERDEASFDMETGLFTEQSSVGNESRFAYQSRAWTSAKPIVCYLTEQHRQDDLAFLSVLSAIRANTINDDHVEIIRERQQQEKIPEDITRLFSHNMDVDRVNADALLKIQEKPHTYTMTSYGRDVVVASLMKGCLSPEKLVLKKGASVMFTKNNQKEGYVNGTLGTVVDFASFTDYPIIKTRNGLLVTVEPMDWTLEENGKIKASVTQLPLRLAWAMTVHKSQGMSLDAAVMDLSQVFEYGQGYVALSRVRRLSGLYLLGINAQVLQVHPEILRQDAQFRKSSENAGNAFAQLAPAELTKMHKNFISTLGGTWQEESAADEVKAEKGGVTASLRHKAKKIPTTDLTLQHLKDKKTIAEIAELRNLKQGTIIEHTQQLLAAKKIEKHELAHLVPTDPKIVADIGVIHRAMDSLGADLLKPIYDYCAGEFPYDLLRLAQLLYSLRG